VEPLLYRTLVIGAKSIRGLPQYPDKAFADIARTKSPAFRRDSMRNLLLSGISTSLAHTYLSLFPGVENLWILTLDTAHVPLPALEIPPLKHLYCFLEDLYKLIPFESFSHPLFTNITHLELFDGNFHPHKNENSTEWTGLIALPHLTHLALTNAELMPLCVSILERYKSLSALLLIADEPTDPPTVLDILAADPRFVITPMGDYLNDWQRGVLAGRDYWGRADEFIAKRLSGEIDSEFPV
jgi:hypothetical protein